MGHDNVGALLSKTALEARNILHSVKDNKHTISNKVLSNNFFTLPNIVGLGIVMIKDKTLTFLADFVSLGLVINL